MTMTIIIMIINIPIHPTFVYIYHVTLNVTICKEILVENSYIKLLWRATAGKAWEPIYIASLRDCISIAREGSVTDVVQFDIFIRMRGQDHSKLFKVFRVNYFDWISCSFIVALTLDQGTTVNLKCLKRYKWFHPCSEVMHFWWMGKRWP